MTVTGDSTACKDKPSFTEVSLSESGKKKVPKRLVYFSDGVLEEYSTDEEDFDQENLDTQPLIDPKTLSWFPFLGYWIWWVGSRTLAVCDYLGENLAWFLGITSPKFQYELDQYERMAKEEEEFENYIKSENAGWMVTESDMEMNDTVKSQPKLEAHKTLSYPHALSENSTTAQNQIKV